MTIPLYLVFLGNAEEHTGLSRALSRLSELEEKVEHIHTEQVRNIYFINFVNTSFVS